MTMVTDPQSFSLTMTVLHSTTTAIMVLLSRIRPASRLTNQMYLAMRLFVRIHQATYLSYQANPPMLLLPRTQNQITHLNRRDLIQVNKHMHLPSLLILDNNPIKHSSPLP